MTQQQLFHLSSHHTLSVFYQNISTAFFIIGSISARQKASIFLAAVALFKHAWIKGIQAIAAVRSLYILRLFALYLCVIIRVQICVTWWKLNLKGCALLLTFRLHSRGYFSRHQRISWEINRAPCEGDKENQRGKKKKKNNICAYPTCHRAQNGTYAHVSRGEISENKIKQNKPYSKKYPDL